MAEVKWIRITTNMFDDEKIKVIEKLPEGAKLLVIWIKLLTLAGRCNSIGYIFLAENIPYTDDMLSTIFNCDVSLIRLALTSFEKFGMIEITEQRYIRIVNWEKHQNVDGMEKIREDTRLRVQKHRQKQLEASSIQLPDCNVTCNVTVTQCNDIEEEKKRIEEDIYNTSSAKLAPYNQIQDLFNDICTALPRIKEISGNRKKVVQARWKENPDIEYFRQLFISVQGSDFLSGRDGKWNNCGFDWILKPTNTQKIVEGNYKNKNPNQAKNSKFDNFQSRYDKDPNYVQDVKKIVEEPHNNSPNILNRELDIEEYLKERKEKPKRPCDENT